MHGRGEPLSGPEQEPKVCLWWEGGGGGELTLPQRPSLAVNSKTGQYKNILS